MIQILPYSEIPSVSILLPIYNEAEFIGDCLNAILKQDYAQDKIEILVIEGRSTDASRSIVGKFQTQYPNITLLDNPQRLQAYGMNLGIKHAHNEIIIRVDGHTLIAPDYVSRCVKTLQLMADQNVANVGGTMRPEGKTLVGRAIAAATTSPFAIPSAFHYSTRPQFVDTVYLGGWPRYVFESIGDFNPEVNINEDYELNYRLRMAGGKIYLNPVIHSTYFCRQSLKALWKQYYQYGIQKVKMLRRFPTAIKLRQVIAPLYILALVGLPILGFVWQGFWLLWWLIIGAYLVAAIIAASQTHNVSWLVVICAFAVIHVAWGSGFWVGWTRILSTLFLRQE